MTQEVKIIAGIAIVSVALLIGAAFLMGNPQAQKPQVSEKADAKLLMRSNAHETGPKSAKVTIVEFADFQCPACGAAHPALKQVLEQYKNDVRFVFRHFPLQLHKNAKQAARAAEAAGAVGGGKKFWEMHDMIFENQAEWSEQGNSSEIFLKYAEKLKLDTAKFKEAMESNTFDQKIQADQNDGITLGVNSTPTFFINQEKYVGVLSFDTYKDLIEKTKKQ
ncbi:MAG: thioredoxin domain-containing protein [Candidatus Levybacteria bacterium]|nr:thioredoxin domain-containing protein [Candidatus Levybacteria bacterium]